MHVCGGGAVGGWEGLRIECALTGQSMPTVHTEHSEDVCGDVGLLGEGKMDCSGFVHEGFR